MQVVGRFLIEISLVYSNIGNNICKLELNNKYPYKKS